MGLLKRDDDTICAVSTAPGVGGLAVIRVSGPKSAESVRALFPALPMTAESHRIYFGTIRDSEGLDIDEVLVSYFQKGRSFTGEEVIEISCHGSPVLSAKILRALHAQGLRSAERGEFTYRAFMNNRLDLVQAESVLALIQSQSEQAARLALRQLKGETSKRLNDMEQRLTHTLAHLEANIDFAHEDIEIASSQDLLTQVGALREETKKLLASYKRGRLVKEGVRVALVGQPNVGKSSLLNALVGDERVIVSEIPGTTRDFVEVEHLIDGVRFVFVDTAGLRETQDPIETMGIEKTWACADSADLVLLVREAGAVLNILEKQVLERISAERLVQVMNKCDLQASQEGDVQISALSRNGFGDLFGLLAARADVRDIESSETLSHERHFELLSKAFEALVRGESSLKEEASPDVVALDLQEALWSLQEILGKQFDDQIMDRVFQEFCLGK